MTTKSQSRRVPLAFFLMLLIGPANVVRAQSLERFSIAAGATVLPMNARSGGTIPMALLSGRINVATRPRWSFGVSAQGMLPLETTTVATDCIPDVPCPTYKSPDSFIGASGQFTIATRSQKLRATAGVGFISAENLSDNTRTNSPTLEAGLEYAFMPARRVSPVVAVRVQRLTRNVAGLEAIILPTFGIVF